MPMQVDVGMQFLFDQVLVHYSGLCSVDCWMANWVWLHVDSVKIKSLSVISPVASLDSIRVQQGDNLKDETIKEDLGLSTILSKHIKHPLKEE